jgi:hypothetical protein
MPPTASNSFRCLTPKLLTPMALTLPAFSDPHFRSRLLPLNIRTRFHKDLPRLHALLRPRRRVMEQDQVPRRAAAQPLGRRPERLLRLGRLVLGAVDLGGEPDVGTRQARVAEGLGDALLVAVGAGRVDVPVAGFEGERGGLAAVGGLVDAFRTVHATMSRRVGDAVPRATIGMRLALCLRGKVVLALRVDMVV